MLVTIAIVLAAMLFGRSAQAEDEPAPPDEPAATNTAADPVATAEFPVVVLGRLVCMPCLLNQQQGASDLCELMNHGHQILVDVAQDRTGNDLPAMRGEVVDYRQPYDAQGIVLTEQHHGKKLLVYGAMEEGHLRIESVRPVREPLSEQEDDAG